MIMRLVPNPLIPDWCRRLVTACSQRPGVSSEPPWCASGPWYPDTPAVPGAGGSRARGQDLWWSWQSSCGAESDAEDGLNVNKDHGEADGGVIPARGGDTTSVTPGSNSNEQALHQPGREIRSPARTLPCGMPGVGQGCGGRSPQHSNIRSAALREGGKGNFSLPSSLRAPCGCPGSGAGEVVLSRSHPAAAPHVARWHHPGLPGHAAPRQWLRAKSWLHMPNWFRGDLWAQRGNGLTSAAARSWSCLRDPCHPKTRRGLCTGGADAPGKLELVPSAVPPPCAVD